MTEPKDTSFYGNNEQYYSSQRQYDAPDPFAQSLPVSGEPLFPASAAPAVTPVVTSSAALPEFTWIESVAEGTALAEQAPLDSVVHGQPLYQWQSYPHPADESALHALPTTEANSEANTQGNAHPQPVEPLGGPAQLESSVDSVPVDSPQRQSPSPEAVRHPKSEAVAETSVVDQKPFLYERDALFNRHFAVLMDMMQYGAWPQALEKLQAMRAEFPNVVALDVLLDEAELKARELMAQWTHKIKGRRLTVGQEWLIRRSLPFFMLLALFISGAIFYRTFVAPSRQVVAMERQNQALIEEATSLLQVGQIDPAIELYNIVLDRNPDFSAAQQGLLDASRLSGLAASYDVAIRVANRGNLDRSLRILQSIKAKSPSFRDIDARITRVSSLLEAEQAYTRAERAFAQHRWMDAIAHYEQTRLIAADYQAARLGVRLSTAYFSAAQKLMTQWPSEQSSTQQIRDFMQRAQQVNGTDESIEIFLTNLDVFMKGERGLRNNLSQAVKTWRELYDVQPNFLGGYLAEQLYRGYLALAAEIREGNPDYARELYTLAAAMPVHDSGEARSQLQALGAAIPPVQPTPTPQPTVAYIAPAVAAAPVAPAATATPEPTATPANTYAGWIAFRSTRMGWEEIYIMRSDGSEQQLAPEEMRARIDTIYQEQRRSPDGRMAFVQSANGRSDANLFVTGSDGVNNMLTDYNTDGYDPVWSPAGDRITFVANHTGNDEIWIMAADGSDPRQLTFNEWEWDKHPTWSPDGSQIAFFSNRSGQRQIWVMAPDGSNQRNLSSNIYDDWDPVWIR